MKLKVNQLVEVGVPQVEIARVCKVSEPAVIKWKVTGIPEKYHNKIQKRVASKHGKIGKLLDRFTKRPKYMEL